MLEVYSKVEDGVWNKTFIDLREGSETKFTDAFLAELKFQPPKAVKQNPPEWACLEQETVSWHSCDFKRIVQSKAKIGPRNFVAEVSDHLGVTYHKMEGDFELTVDDEHVWFIDPLFLTPGMKGYDLNDYRAQEMQQHLRVFQMKRVLEMSNLPHVVMPQFGLKDEFAEIAGTFATSKFANSRFKFMRKYNGIIIVRNGRVIAVEKDYIPFRNNDFNIGVMLEFSGKADEYFGLTTLKNTLSIKEETKALFDKLGLVNEISNVRAERQKLFSEWRRPADIKLRIKAET